MPEPRPISPEYEDGMPRQSGHTLGESGVMTEQFNPTMMVIARQLHDWNQADLADKTGKTQAYISKVERLILPPSDEFVRTLAEKTEFPISFFYQPGYMGGLPVSVHPMFRKQQVAVAKQTSKVKVLDRVNAEMSIRIFHLRVLETALLRLSQKFTQARSTVMAEATTPKGAAKALRKFHARPSGPISDLTKIAEDSGILVFHCDFGDDTDEMVDGVSMHVPGLPPTIFLNENRPADRLRFSLAHEMGHIFLHRVPSDEMEIEANDFAGELLMPEEDMNQIFTPPVSLNKLAAMKPDWKVSVQALLYRAGKLHFIDEGTKNALWREINRLGWKKHEPAFLDFEPEHPNLVKEILGSVGSNLSGMLHTYQRKLEEMYQIAS